MLFRSLAEVLDAYDVERFAWVQYADSEQPVIAGYEVSDRQTVGFLADVDLEVTTMETSR